MITVLVVENRPPIAAQLKLALEEIGYRVIPVDGYHTAMSALLQAHSDLILADIQCGGCELCLDLRDAEDAIPFIVLLENAAKRDKRIIFRSRADGYLEIPFDAEELQMRVRNLLWRCHIEDSAVVQYGDCRLYTDSYTVRSGHITVELRRMEFLLLEKLLSYPGRIFTRAQLMDELWGYDCQSDPRTVDAHIRQLRKKLRCLTAIRLQTIRGIGYRAALPRRGGDGLRESLSQEP